MVHRNLIECFSCHRRVEMTAWQCPFCGASVAPEVVALSTARRFLRCLAAAAFGGTAITVAALAPMDGLRTLGPVLLLVGCLAGILWLWAGRFEPPRA